MAHEFQMNRRVEFHETDMAGIVHFSNFFRYMEETEHAFFGSLGIRVHSHTAGRLRGFARVDARCRYDRPLRYLDEIRVHLLVERRGRRSLKYRFRFVKIADEGSPCAPVDIGEGSLSVVYVTRKSEDEELRATELDAEVVDNIEAAPPKTQEHLAQENDRP